MESLGKRHDETRNKLAELRKIKEERRQRKQERQKMKEQRLQKLELVTTPEEVKNLKRALKLEDEHKHLERMQELKKSFQEHKKAIKLDNLKDRLLDKLKHVDKRKKKKKKRNSEKNFVKILNLQRK